MPENDLPEKIESCEVSIERTGCHHLAAEPAFLTLMEAGWRVTSVFLAPAARGRPGRYHVLLCRDIAAGPEPNEA